MTVPAAAAAGYSLLVLAAVVAPAVVLESAGDRGGVRGAVGADLIGVSAAVGVPAAVLAWRGVRRTTRAGRSRTDVWIAASCGLVTVAVAASALPTVVLHATTGLPVLDADAGWPVPALWAVCLGAAVVAGEASRRGVLRWLAG
ncbi:hypothetical protein [Modestobacter lapidis]|nr:hypothetical protein [Modestobacter lapidis]